MFKNEKIQKMTELVIEAMLVAGKRLLLTEAFSTIRRGRIQKRAAFAGAAAMSLARKKKDPLYTKYQRLNHMRIMLKQQIKRKNMARARALSMKRRF